MVVSATAVAAATPGATPSVEKIIADFLGDCCNTASKDEERDDPPTTEGKTKKKRKLSNEQRFAIVEFLDEFKIREGPAVERGRKGQMARRYQVDRKTIGKIWERYIKEGTHLRKSHLSGRKLKRPLEVMKRSK